jgi:hypothetical protein
MDVPIGWLVGGVVGSCGDLRLCSEASDDRLRGFIVHFERKYMGWRSRVVGAGDRASRGARVEEIRRCLRVRLLPTRSSESAREFGEDIFRKV